MRRSVKEEKERVREELERSGVCPTCGRGHDGEAHGTVNVRDREEPAAREEGGGGGGDSSAADAANVLELEGRIAECARREAGAEAELARLRREQRDACRELERMIEGERRRVEVVERAERDVEVWREQLEKGEAKVLSLAEDLAEKQSDHEKYTELEKVFGYRGIQGYVLEDVVAELEEVSQKYVDELSDGELRLELRVADGERVGRTAAVWREGGDGEGDGWGEWVERPLSQLSGGQWRRMSLGLLLGYRELAERRGRWAGNVLVLDEPLTHLDGEGRRAVGKVLANLLGREPRGGGGGEGEEGEGGGASGAARKGSLDSIMLILQDSAADDLEEDFDAVDVVVRDERSSRVEVDV